MTDFKDLMRQAQEVRDRFQRLQEELGGRTVEGSAGGGMVVVVMNGRQELLSLRIEKEVVSPDDVGMPKGSSPVWKKRTARRRTFFWRRSKLPPSRSATLLRRS